MAQEWDIKPRGEACRECAVPFADKQPYFSSLVFGEEGYSRADYCDDCWQKKSAALTPYSSWQGIFQMPPPKPEEPLRKENAESLLRRLMEDNNEKNGNVIYILAVMLERNRVLVEREVQIEGDSTIRVYEHRKTGEMFVIPDPRLQLDQLEHVQQEVLALLGGGTSKDEPAKDPAPPDGEVPASVEENRE